MRYLFVLAQGQTSVGAYVPDLPGCAAVGDTREEALALIREAIALHIEELRRMGDPAPPPSSTGELIEVFAA